MENPTYHLEGVIKERDSLADFEGPLGLILMLLSKNKIEIRDIRVSELVDQYMDYLAEMEDMNLEIASEFVQMLAYLLYIKTRMLLTPEPEEITELEQLMSSLEQLQRKDTLEAIKQLLPQFAERAENGFRLLTRGRETLPRGEYEYRHSPQELLGALLKVFSREDVKMPGIPELRALAPRPIVYNVRDKSREIIERLKRGKCLLGEIYSSAGSRSELVAAFLSVLELCSMGSVVMEDEPDGGILLSFVGGDVEEIIEAIEE